MSADDHGDASTYCNHQCRCDLCRNAHRIDQYAQRRSRHARLAADPNMNVPHGRNNTYGNWGCRCDPCIEAHRLTRSVRRRAKATGGLWPGPVNVEPPGSDDVEPPEPEEDDIDDGPYHYMPPGDERG